LKPSLNILHANPHTLARAGLKTILSDQEGISMIHEAETMEKLVESLRDNHYDLVIIDYDQQSSFSRLDIAYIKEYCPGTKILVVSSEKDQQEINSILESGVNGCVTRACSEREIVNAVYSISNGEKFICNRIIDMILHEHLRRNGESKPANCEPTSLTPREIEVTRLIAVGFTNKETAEKLYLSIHTVHTHRKNIMKKLGIRTASELVRYAISVGIIQPE
jgi:DNA-binding NarL/FixJ family response regulator